ncbi:hypothetical protein LSAT2_012875 [Lamellibrachia satsuma]|nr:hypothetical protein LSAT2_012875 [Lamellibrachia satsuma]
MGFTYIGWALATPDGLPVKTDKAKLMHQLEDDAALEHHPCLDDLGAYVVDGNALLQHSLLCLRHLESCLRKNKRRHDLTMQKFHRESGPPLSSFKHGRKRIFHIQTSPLQLDMGGRSTITDIWNTTTVVPAFNGHFFGVGNKAKDVTSQMSPVICQQSARKV